MPGYLLRVWVPDRPGALGAVATRIGSVGGDLIGIDILERGGGRAIDELVVELSDEAVVPLLLARLGQLDGVDVEDLRPLGRAQVDPRLDALETAAALVAERRAPDLLVALARRSAEDFQADWSVILQRAAAHPRCAEAPVVAVGDAPPVAWLDAFVAGSRASNGQGGGPDDVAWTDLRAADVVVLLGRAGRPWRARERRQLEALARIVDHRWKDLARPAALAR